jgi:hypothetical protein
LLAPEKVVVAGHQNGDWDGVRLIEKKTEKSFGGTEHVQQMWLHGGGRPEFADVEGGNANPCQSAVRDIYM